MVDVHVVALVFIGHHVGHVVIVGHSHGHSIRIGATQIALGVVSQIVFVLIPVELVNVRIVFHTVGMALGITLRSKEFPAATGHLIGSRCHSRLTHRDEVTRQDNLRRGDILHYRNTALERQVYVQHMALTDRCHVAAGIGLVVVVLINHGDNLLLRQVIDIALTAHIQR